MHILAYVSDQRRTKLKDKSSKYIFIGYNTRFKTYKLFDPKDNKIYVSGNMEFDEDGV